jgi:hypothetical protein
VFRLLSHFCDPLSRPRNRAPVEVVVAQDEVDRAINGLFHLQQQFDDVVALPDVAADDQRIALVAERQKELPARICLEEIQVDVCQPSQLHDTTFPLPGLDKEPSLFVGRRPPKKLEKSLDPFRSMAIM